jgi:hypothetical protein
VIVTISGVTIFMKTPSEEAEWTDLSWVSEEEFSLLIRGESI